MKLVLLYKMPLRQLRLLGPRLGRWERDAHANGWEWHEREDAWCKWRLR